MFKNTKAKALGALKAVARGADKVMDKVEDHFDAPRDAKREENRGIIEREFGSVKDYMRFNRPRPSLTGLKGIKPRDINEGRVIKNK